MRLLKVSSKITQGRIEILHVKKLSGSANKYRVRVGKYRIIFERVEGANEIIEIKKRNDNTYK